MIQQTHELGLGPKWAEEYIEHSIDAIQSDINKENTGETIENTDNPNFAYSKFMKFMKQEGDVPIDSNQGSLPGFDNTSREWTEQYEGNFEKSAEKVSDNSNQEDELLSKVEEELAVAGNWIDEFQKDNTASGLYTLRR